MLPYAVPDPNNLPQLKRRAWLFAGPALLAALAFLVLVCYRQGAFSTTDRLYFVTNSAIGITSGMPVKLNGFVVGSVARITLLSPSTQSDERVRVELGIYRDYMSYIPKATKVRLLQEGLIGQSVIEFLPQRFDSRPVASGEMLPFERSKGLGEIAEQLQERLNPVLQNVQTLTANLNDPQGPFQQTLKAAGGVMSEMPETNRQLQQTMAQTTRSIQSVEQHVNGAFDTIGHAWQTVDKATPGVVGKVEATTDNLQHASADLRAMTQRASATVPAIIDNAQSVTSRGNQIVQDASQTWPINVFTRQPEARALPLDSQEGLPAAGVAGGSGSGVAAP